jgi:hypothetical protein
VADPALIVEPVTVWRTRLWLARLFANLALVMVASAAVLLGFSLANVDARSDALFLACKLALFGCAPLAAMTSIALAWERPLEFRRIEVFENELVLVGNRERRVIPRDIVESAFTIGYAHVIDKPRALLGLRGDELLTVEGDTTPLVQAIAFGPHARRFVVHTGGRWRRLGEVAMAVAASVVVWPFLSAILFLGLEPILGITNTPYAYAVALTFVVPCFVLSRVFARRRVTIGDDGFVLERLFGTKFFPVESIVSTVGHTWGAEITVQNGRSSRRIKLKTDTSAKTDAILSHLGHGMGALKERGQPRRDVRVAREGRSISEWREEVRRLVTMDQGYRTEAVSPDLLLGAVSDARAPADMRLGAAMAIGLGNDAEAKRQVRVAAESIASERLRAAMLGAAEGEVNDTELEWALEEEKKKRSG